MISFAHAFETAIAAVVIALEISNRNARVQALNDRWNELRSALQRLLSKQGRHVKRPRWPKQIAVSGVQDGWLYITEWLGIADPAKKEMV
jgi:hypothetical protein